MSIEIKIPSVGESVQEAVLAEWFKQDGDTVLPRNLPPAAAGPGPGRRRRGIPLAPSVRRLIAEKVWMPPKSRGQAPAAASARGTSCSTWRTPRPASPRPRHRRRPGRPRHAMEERKPMTPIRRASPNGCWSPSRTRPC
jgi:hypothetical protein